MKTRETTEYTEHSEVRWPAKRVRTKVNRRKQRERMKKGGTTEYTEHTEIRWAAKRDRTTGEQEETEGTEKLGLERGCARSCKGAFRPTPLSVLSVCSCSSFSCFMLQPS